MNGHHNWLLDAVLAPVSFVGECGAVWIVLGIVMLIVGKPGWRRTGLLMLVTMLVVDRLIAANLGHYYDRERPYIAMQGIRQFGICWKNGSFPSGHAHSVWIAAIILSSRWPRLALPLVVFALLTCYSRPYFGMHYPGDVIAGSVLGIGAGFAVVCGERILERRRLAKARA